MISDFCGPVAQLDRASDFGSEGWGFDSLRGRQVLVGNQGAVELVFNKPAA